MGAYHSKKIGLPGGREVEIVFFSDPADQQSGGAWPADPAALGDGFVPPALPQGPAREELHLCPSCGSDLVHPIDWHEADDDTWTIERRCPNCEWREIGTFSQDEAECFDDALGEGTEELLCHLRRMSRLNMEADITSFIAALWADLIEPIDF